eukprot:TRINITY_DN67895_c14_g1_i1.p2 TRINITY_DN67895_c14_g1~~TRINITY_DN67895_c14_g1_i1.p2  ORF type:complete len:167 (-),score=20.88 TRINITY_DN67895_c14_g1_i1:288-761(-)
MTEQQENPGILKRKGSIHEHPEHITWDEQTIAEQMRERELNPKMKIDEPPTPYNHYDAEKDEELKDGQTSPDKVVQPTALDISARLVMASGQLEEKTKDSEKREAAGSPDDDEAKFKAKRRAVYADEGARFKALLAKGFPDEDDEDDEEDDGASPKP